MPRDPRIDPRPGDKIRKGGFVCTVDSCTVPNMVFFMKHYVPSQASLEYWRKWTADATILKVQPDAS